MFHDFPNSYRKVSRSQLLITLFVYCTHCKMVILIISSFSLTLQGLHANSCDTAALKKTDAPPPPPRILISGRQPLLDFPHKRHLILVTLYNSYTLLSIGKSLIHRLQNIYNAFLISQDSSYF